MSRERATNGGQSWIGRYAREASRAEYISSAPVGDVLREQLDYLIDHAQRSCAPGCEDCVRLQQVQGWLLLPFRGSRNARKSFRAA